MNKLEKAIYRLAVYANANYKIKELLENEGIDLAKISNLEEPTDEEIQEYVDVIKANEVDAEIKELQEILSHSKYTMNKARIAQLIVDIKKEQNDGYTDRQPRKR